MAEKPMISMLKLLDNLTLRELRAFMVLLRHLIAKREEQELTNFKQEMEDKYGQDRNNI